MDLLQKVKNILGNKCIGISINSVNYQSHELMNQPMRFCEAVSNSFKSPFKIDKLLINCSGARRCLNVTPKNKELASMISMNKAAEILRISLNDMRELEQAWSFK